jgi:hypothetical protein
MIGLINGSSGNNITLFKDADDSLNCMVLEDDGTPMDITGLTCEAVFYKNKTRDHADDPVLEASGIIVTATAGFFTVALANTDMTFGPGTYYIYLRITDTPDIFYAITPAKVTVT